LTNHLDNTEKEYNKIYKEYKKRMNEWFNWRSTNIFW
jgi:hypothetical protein